MADGFARAIKAPAVASGMGLTCISTRKPVDSSGETSPLKNKATIKINAVNIIPDRSPDKRGDCLQSFKLMKPEEREERHIIDIEMGAMTESGSGVLKAISARKNDIASAPSSDMAVARAESVNTSNVELARIALRRRVVLFAFMKIPSFLVFR